MSNIHGLGSIRAERNNDDEEDNRYVGGVGAQGGGSGLAVQPNPLNDSPPADPTASIFSQAEQDSEPSATGSRSRRTITMYRSGFTVDDGVYRRLNDPSNREFLTALAQGRVPRELSDGPDGTGPGMEVSLIDKRTEEYVETFKSFSGTGESLGASESASADQTGVVNPTAQEDNAAASLPEVAAGTEGATSVQVRLLSGKRTVIRILKSATIGELTQRLNSTGMAGTEPYVLVSGFPPKPISDLNQTVGDAGIGGASVQQRKV